MNEQPGEMKEPTRPMTEESDWITLATTPPIPQDEFDRLARHLDDARIETNLEENLVRQCENDPAFWLRVRTRDLPLAWDIARQLSITPGIASTDVARS